MLEWAVGLSMSHTLLPAQQWDKREFHIHTNTEEKYKLHPEVD